METEETTKANLKLQRKYGSGTFRTKTSSSRDGSRKKYFSNGTFPPGTVRAFFKNDFKVLVIKINQVNAMCMLN